MAFHYPNGQLFSQKNSGEHSLQKETTFANRGMRFEDAINQSNEYYLTHDKAVVHKKPTPLQIVKVDYPKRSAAVIKEAYFRQASTTDYNGVYHGYYLDFEAKETKNKASFPLKNFHQHQITHMQQCLRQDAVCFVLLWFSSLSRCFFLAAEELIFFWDSQENGKKSIPLKTIEEVGIEIAPKIAPRIPYLAAVEQYLEKRSKSHG
ncbi:Holliday junction resolvase RecU [Enterococcus pseudoavium]|uniref:Holliday junction resolvase RecU n=1 Tax=Enterococcus pseudoavium TaxID=44007 RepID=A0AAE4KWI4_9ENTE|nr:Holliday junction resolvase RecU [Enterococcus pseudoavium]MDT2736640.1 Holliday junction resolvase RecU [Enterococcus pseudoavium]MDT2753643.1 Holliday junction resolvase RecU [Enterococcus pseudoavium]MDT2771226.1 Holliday junction resolvase RecU [Enterococcus pseudoavium]REC31696.1 Holliday junction resolvase RecU [Enterococcus pseudoavium]